MHPSDCQRRECTAPVSLLDLVDRYLARGGVEWGSTWRLLLLVVGPTVSAAVGCVLLYLLLGGTYASLAGICGALGMGGGTLVRKAIRSNGPR